VQMSAKPVGHRRLSSKTPILQINVKCFFFRFLSSSLVDHHLVPLCLSWSVHEFLLAPSPSIYFQWVSSPWMPLLTHHLTVHFFNCLCAPAVSLSQTCVHRVLHIPGFVSAPPTAHRPNCDSYTPKRQNSGQAVYMAFTGYKASDVLRGAALANCLKCLLPLKCQRKAGRIVSGPFHRLTI